MIKFVGLSLLVFSAMPLSAQLTTISQFVDNADGSPFKGIIQIQVQPFNSINSLVRSSDIYLCSPDNVITGCLQQIINGVVTVALEPNGGSTPPGTSYFVSYYPEVPPGVKAAKKTEYWVVPIGGPYTIAQVVVPTPPVPGIQVSPTQLNSTGYTTGQFPCVVGGTFLPCSPAAGAAIWGQISGILSNQLDLQAALDGKASASAGVQYVTTPPSGSCVSGNSQLTVNTTNGASSICVNNVWAAFTGVFQSNADPTGSCVRGEPMRYNYNNLKLWACSGGIWSYQPNISPISTFSLNTSTVTLVPAAYVVTTDGSGRHGRGCWMIDAAGNGTAVGYSTGASNCLYFSSGNVATLASGQTVTAADGSTIQPSGTGTVSANKVILQPGAQPACSSANRAQQWFVAGGAGVQDSFSICAKDAGDVYAWRAIY